MTEAEWLNGTDPGPLLEFLSGRVAARKVRLFAVACCQRVLPHLTDERSRQALQTALLYADGRAGPAELERASEEARLAAQQALAAACQVGRTPHAWKNLNAAWAAHGATLPVLEKGGAAVALQAQAVAGEAPEARDEARRAQCHILRDLFGNPGRPAVSNPAWMTPRVVQLALEIYETGAFHRMPALARELLEAGCRDNALLMHCRQGGDHVRGCWVVDALLGKQPNVPRA